MADENDYWLTFVIRDERGRDGRTYGERYTAVVEAVSHVASMTWDETTSFYLMRSSFSLGQICGYIKTAIDESKDTVLIRRLDQATARIVGVFYNDNLNKFLPYLQRA